MKNPLEPLWNAKLSTQIAVAAATVVTILGASWYFFGDEPEATQVAQSAQAAPATQFVAAHPSPTGLVTAAGAPCTPGETKEPALKLNPATGMMEQILVGGKPAMVEANCYTSNEHKTIVHQHTGTVTLDLAKPPFVIQVTPPAQGQGNQPGGHTHKIGPQQPLSGVNGTNVVPSGYHVITSPEELKQYGLGDMVQFVNFNPNGDEEATADSAEGCSETCGDEGFPTFEKPKGRQSAEWERPTFDKPKGRQSIDWERPTFDKPTERASTEWTRPTFEKPPEREKCTPCIKRDRQHSTGSEGQSIIRSYQARGGDLSA